MNSTARRPARVPSLSIVLPHPPLPRRCSISKSPDLVAATPRTPRSSCSSTPGLFKLDAVTSRTSNESRMSWNSSYDGLEDEMEWEWRQEQVMLLAKTMDALPSHILTPFNGTAPPSNLVDKIARGIIRAKGPLDWPHSVHATRTKLLELWRAREKENAAAARTIDNDLPSTVLQTSTNMPPKRLYRQSSMDFLQQGDKLKDGETIARLSSRLQRADRIIPNPAYHPYARPGSRSPSPVGDDGQRIPLMDEIKPRNYPSSLSSTARRTRLRRSTTMVSGLATIEAGVVSPCTPPATPFLPPRISKRSESFSSSSLNPRGNSLKRAPSFGGSSAKSQNSSSKMSLDDQKENKLTLKEEPETYPSSDEEEKVRSRKAKKARTRSSSPPPSTPSDKSVKTRSQKSSSKSSSSGTTSGSLTPTGSTRSKKSAKLKPTATSLFGAELPNAQQEPSPPQQIPSSISQSPVRQSPAKSDGSPVQPKKTLRRVKAANFHSIPARRLSFGGLLPTVNCVESSQTALGSAFDCS